MVEFQQDPEILELGADASDLVSAAAQVDALAASIERLQAAVSATSTPRSGSAETQIKSLQELAGAFIALDEVRKNVGPELETFITGLGKSGLESKDFSAELGAITASLAKFEKELKRATESDPGNTALKADVDRRLAILKEFRDRAIKTMTDGNGVGDRDFISTLLGSRRSGAPLKGLESALISDIKGLASSPGIRDAIVKAANSVRKSIDEQIGSARSAVSTRSARLEREPEGLRDNISREAGKRRFAAERRRIADLESRASDAASDARRDPEIQKRVFGTRTSDESQAIKIAKDRESRLREVSEATRKANEEAQRLREEQAILERNLQIARDNEGAVSEAEAKADVDRRFAAGDDSPRIYRMRVPGPGPQDIKELERRLAENSRLLTAARAKQSTYTRELSDFLSADPLDGLKLPKSVDPARLKKLIADRMVQSEISRITKETGSAPDAGTIEEFRSFISQQGTGAAARLAEQLITERRSESPLFDRAQSARSARRRPSAASTSGGKQSPSGLDAEGIYLEKDLRTIRAERDAAARRITELSREAKKAEDRLRAVRAAAEDVLGEDELALREESDRDRRRGDGGPVRQSNEEDQGISESDVARRLEAIGSAPDQSDEDKEARSLAGGFTSRRQQTEGATAEFYERQIALFMKEQTEARDKQGNVLLDDKNKPIMRNLTREEAIEIIAEEFDATSEEIMSSVGSAPSKSEMVDDAFIDAAAKSLAQTAKNKIYRDENRGLSEPEVKSLQAAIRRALRAMILGEEVKPKDADTLISNLIAREVEDAFSAAGVGTNLSGDNRSLPGGAPGSRQSSSGMDIAIEKAGVLGRADAESAATGRSTEDVIRSQLDDAEERAKKAADALVQAQDELRRLEQAVQDPTAGTSRFFDILGISDKRIGGVDPLDLLSGRTPGASAAQRNRARKIAARTPFGFSGVAGSSLAVRPSDVTGAGFLGRAGSEQFEGTVGAADSAENPVASLFTRRRVVANTETGAQLSTTGIKPAEAEPAIQFLKELFQSTQILTADMASLLAEGKSIKQNDIDDLAANLGLMKVAYDQVASLKSDNPAVQAAISSLISQFEQLAKNPSVQRLFSPEFIGQAVPAAGEFAASEAGVIRKTESLDQESKISLAKELIEITRAVGQGGSGVVAGMQTFGDIRTQDPAGSGAARLPRSGQGAPESLAVSAQAIQRLAAEIMIAGRPDSEAAKKELTALISELIARGDLIPADLIGLIDDPALAKEMKDAATRNVPSLEIERVPTRRGQIIRRELYGEEAKFTETGEVIPAVPSRYQRQFEPGYKGPIRLESEVQEEIRQKVSQAIEKDVTIDQLKNMANESFGVGYKLDSEGKRVPGPGRAVQDIAKSGDIVAFVQKILSLEEVVSGLADSIKRLFDEKDVAGAARSDAELEDVADARDAEESLAQSKIAIAESAIRIAEMRKAKASGISGPSLMSVGSFGRLSKDMNVEAEGTSASDVDLDKENAQILRDIEVEKELELTDPREVQTERGLARSFRRIKSVDELESFGPGAINALAFNALPPALVNQLIAENPGLLDQEDRNNPITKLTDYSQQTPEGGVLKVSREAAVAVLEALNRAGVRISVGKFTDEEGRDQIVSTTHLGEELSDDVHASTVAGVVAKEIQRNGVAGNALTAITTPKFVSYTGREGVSSQNGVGGLVSNVAGFAQPIGVTGAGVVRSIQVPRRVIRPGVKELSKAPRNFGLRGVAAHEFGHTVTTPYGENSRQSMIAALEARMEALGISEDQIQSVISSYATTSPLEALAEAYRIMNGYVYNEEEKEVAEGTDEFGSSGIIGAAYQMIEMAKKNTARSNLRAMEGGGIGRPGFMRANPESQRIVTSRLPGAGSISSGVTRNLFSDVTEKGGASFRISASDSGSPEVTENTPQTGFMVGGRQKYNLNLPASEVMPLPIPGSASDEEIQSIKEENNRRRAKFRAAVQKIIAENASEVKEILAAGEELYIGSWIEDGKVAIDLTERISYLPGDEASQQAALDRAMAIAKSRKQQSIAQITASPGEGRGTGAGYGATAFPSTGIENPQAMATQRTWVGDATGWSEEPDTMAATPNAMSAGDDFEKTLIKQMQDDPSSDQAVQNYIEYLQLMDVAADEIARRVNAAMGIVQAETRISDAKEEKAKVVEKVATAAEDELGLFEDFDESEYEDEGFIDDDTSNTSEIIEEVKGSDQRTEVAAERVAAAKEEIAVATEEIATAVEGQADSAQATASETEATSESAAPAETVAATTTRLDEIDAELQAIFEKKQELQAKLQEAVTSQALAAASLQDRIEQALNTLETARIDRLADELVQLENETDREMVQREARFRRTEKGQKVNRKTGEYSYDFVPAVYGPETEEYKQLIAEGFSPDKDNAFGERDLVFAEKSRNFRYDISRPANLAEEVGLSPVRGGEAQITRLEDVQGYARRRQAGAEGEVSQQELDDAKAALEGLKEVTAPATTEIRNLTAEIESLNAEDRRLRANRENIGATGGLSANDEAAISNKDAILQRQIIPEQLAPIIELLNKTLATADQKLEARGIDTSNLTAKEKASALGDMDVTARKLKYLIDVIESASKTSPAVQGGGVFLPRTVLPSGTTGKTPDAQLKSASRITGMLPNEVSAVSGVIERINASLKSLEAQAASGEIDLETLAASLQNVSSEARLTAASLLETTDAEKEKAGAGGAGGGKGGDNTTTGGAGGPMDDPNNDWRKIRATVPDTENISRGIADLAKLQNRFAELGPVITHVAGANQQFGQSLDYSANRAEKASATLQRLTDTNVGVLKTVRTQVGRAATFLVLQQLGREIGGIVEHLQSGVFKFNQVLENTQVGFNTLFANTLQANASVGNQLVPKLNEAGVQIGFMREQSVKFSDAINYTAGAASNMVEEIRNIANVTPFRFQPLVEASLKMKAFGFEAAEIPGMINSISNAVAALGGEDEKIDRIAYALGQMNSAGRVYQNDMMQLANAGIAGYRMLSEKLLMDLTAMKNRAMGVLKDVPEETAKEFDRLQGMLNSASFKKSFGSIDEMIRTLEDPKRAEGLIRNLAKRGFLIGSTAARAITEGMDKQYQGSADRLSRTMTGALSTIADLSQNFMATAFQPLFNSVRDTIVEVGQFMLKSAEITKFVDGVRDRMQSFIQSLAAFGPALEGAGKIFIDVFVSGLGSALDKGTQFGAVIGGVIGKLGPGLKLIGDILMNDVGKGLVVATLAFSLFSKAISANPMIATITLLVAAISGIAAAIQNNTLFVGSFVKTFIPSIEQLLKVIGEGVGTVLNAFSGSAMTGFIAGLSVAINALMPLLTIFLTTMSVLLKILTPLAGPLGFIVGLFIALKTAMMAFDLAGTVVGKVMNGINSAWGSVNNAIDTQIEKVKQTAAAYDELKRAKIAAEDFKRNDRGELLDENNQVTKDKSKAALMWGQGEKIESYGMTDFKGRMAERALTGQGRIPGLLAVDRTRQQATDAMQNMMTPDFGKGFYLSHDDKVLGHTTPVIDNKKIEGTYDYLNLAAERKKQFENQNAEAIMDQTLTPEQQNQYKSLQEAAKLREQASAAGMFRFAGLDMGKTDTEKVNDKAGAYSYDNMWGAILVQKETSWILNKAFTDLEAAGKQIEAMKSEVEKIKAAMESGEITTEDGEARISQLKSSMDNIRRGQAGNMSIVGGLAEAGVSVMDQDGKVDPEKVKRLTVDDFGKRGINIPPGVAAGIKKLPENVQNIVLSQVLERYAKGEVFATKQEEEQFLKGVLGEARGKAALKASTIGVFNKAGNAMGNLFKKITDRAPRILKTIERGGGKTGLSEIDSRGGKYYYVDSETGMLGNEEVSAEELRKRERMRGFQKGGMMDKMRGMASTFGKAAVGAGLASGARRLAGEVAPILATPIIGPLVELLPKEMTNVLKQKAGPFQAMAQGIGTTAGSILGQALIPIPGVGAMLGGLIGGALAEFVGNAVDRAIAGSEAAMEKKKQVMEEATFLGFSTEQSKKIGEAVNSLEGDAGAFPLIVNDPAAGYAAPDSRANLEERYQTDFGKDVVKERQAGLNAFMDSGVGKALIGTPIGGIIAAAMIGGENGILGIGASQEGDERVKAYAAFREKQAEFMSTALPLQDLMEVYGQDAMFTKQRLYEFKMIHSEEMKMIEGKLARNEELSISEERLKKEFERLTAAAASSPMGVMGTITDTKIMSPTMMAKLIDQGARGKVTKEEAEKSEGKLKEGDFKEGFSKFESLLATAEIQFMTAGAGFGTKTADALSAAGFDYSKITAETTDKEVIAMIKDALKPLIQARVRGKELTPKVDLSMTRIEMMETFGGEAGYKLFDKYAGQRDEYQKKQKEFDALGGEARLAFLQSIADESILGSDYLSKPLPGTEPAAPVIPPTTLPFTGRTGAGGPIIPRGDYVIPSAEFASDRGLSQQNDPMSKYVNTLLTTEQSVELENLKKKQKELTDARYETLEVDLKLRTSLAGATETDRAAGRAAEEAFIKFKDEKGKEILAALKAGKNATADQLDLLKQEAALKAATLTTATTELNIGDALQTAEAAGLNISYKDLTNNSALVEILLAKQRIIDGLGGAQRAQVTAKGAEIIAEGFITQAAVHQLALATKQAKVEELKLRLKDPKEAANRLAISAEIAKLEGQGPDSIAASSKEYERLNAIASKWLDKAAEADPMKLTKKEIDTIKKLIAKDPGSILGGDGGAKDSKTLQKNIDLLNKMANIAQKTYDRMRKEQQRTHDEYMEQLNEQEKRINERYQQRSDLQTEENLQAQLQIAGLQMRSSSADPLEAAKSFYDAKQALEQFYIDQQRDAELKVIADEKERYDKQFNESSTASQAIYDAALQRLNSRFEFAQQVLNGDEKMAGKMNDALRMTMFGGDIEGMVNIDGEVSSAANTAFNEYKKGGGANYKKYAAISKANRTKAQQAVVTKYESLLAAARKESAVNAMLNAVSGISGEQDITMTTDAEQDLAKFESENRDAIAAAIAANENMTTDQEELLGNLAELRAVAEAAQKDALLGALGSIGQGILYNSKNPFEAVGGGFTGGIKGLTYGGTAVTGNNVKDVLKVYQGSTEESGLAATFLNEAIMGQMRYTDQNGKEYAGAGNILAYLTGVINNMGGSPEGVTKLNAEQDALYKYLRTLVSSKNTFTDAQKTAILAQRTLEQGLNDFEQSTGLDINIANLAEADVTDKQFTDYFTALGKTFEDNAAREAAIQKMRDVLRDTYGQALLSVDVEQYAKFADSSDERIGTLSGVAKSLKDVMDQIDGIMSNPNKMTSLDKLLFGADFDPNNISGTGPVSNLKFGKTQIDAVTTAVTATRDAFESSMNSIKAYASELSGPLGAFHQQTIEDAGTVGTAMANAANSFSLATVQVNMYADALAAAAAAKQSLGIDPNFATGIGAGGATGSATPAANNTYNITVNNAEGMDAQQLAAELARLIAQQAGSTVN